MNSDSIQRLLSEIATERIEGEWNIINHKRSVELCWEYESLERSIIILFNSSDVQVDASVMFDDEDADERLWTYEEVATVNPSYSNVISSAIQAGLTAVQKVTVDELKVVDSVPS